MPTWYADPPLLLALLFIVIGFVVLIKGADTLVGGAVAIAERFQLSPAVIGATVVAFGTSLPELAVSLFSVLEAVQTGTATDPDGPVAISVGNIVGSNIFNIGAILGVSALVVPMTVARSSMRWDYPVMVAAGALLVLASVPLFGPDPIIARWNAVILIVCLIGFTVWSIKNGSVEVDPELEELLEKESHVSPGKATWLIVLGIVMLVIGGDITLAGGIAVAQAAGLEERVIGLTVMAMGTSLPELATSIQAARRGQSEMAVANVLGSNCFNVFCIIGITAAIIPLPVSQSTLVYDYPWMFAFFAALVPAVFFMHRFGRLYGVVLVTMLVVYVSSLLIMGEPAAPLPTS